ncbi:uncharacterized protein PV06_00641 [Exophiala oligosperma]|uniref:Transcription factor domain-containing protein n=2 Tax=Chaetothyriales TaxID=34395 RepID=A0A0D2CDX7_9EURO|nr:uncharacterized protein PV06_00641 [Exophiala oligosperma]KAJ9620307.1 hypothetical protein H2204_012343 [Knufia peltigerae]KIW48002.1 hypothetical protein PV06_00641 [Exophiala oligosperma]
MAQTQYTAGLRFILKTSDQQISEEDRKGAVSHASKARWKVRRKARSMRSWIDPDRSLQEEKSAIPPGASKRSNTIRLPSPRPTMIDETFSATELPPGIEPGMIQELVKLINMDKVGIYPYEICLQVHPVQRGWFPYMINDLCCLHSMMFSVRAFVDGMSNSNRTSPLAAFHYDQTLRLLQARIDAFERGLCDEVCRDSTIMVIITLATAAEIGNDLTTARIHLDGLRRIVNLRGGLRQLDTHTNVQVKVCRADLSLALRSGLLPSLFLHDEIDWDCYIADRGLVRCRHIRYEPTIRAFTDNLDPKLRNCWKDVHAFSCLSNLAYQTDRKMSPEMYNEMMIAILYRLTHLSFNEEKDLPNEVIRVALLVFCTTLFLIRCYLDHPYERLIELYKVTLVRLCQCRSEGEHLPPKPVMFWLVMLYHVVPEQETTSSSSSGTALYFDKEYYSQAEVDTWEEALTLLKSIMWIDFVHGNRGREIFEDSRTR